MPQTHPNRTRNDTVHNPKREKESGDQHLLPEDEPLQDPHQPHRLSREDMQKLGESAPNPDDPTAP